MVVKAVTSSYPAAGWRCKSREGAKGWRYCGNMAPDATPETRYKSLGKTIPRRRFVYCTSKLKFSSLSSSENGRRLRTTV